MRNDAYKYNTVGVGQVTLWNYQAEFPRYGRHQLAQVYKICTRKHYSIIL